MRNAPPRGKVDKNFDTLFESFQKRIYGSTKGELRLELLQEDLGFLRDGQPLDVWDAGCGMGQMALWFASAGHRVTANDISRKMLAEAQRRFAEAGCDAQWFEAPAQEVARRIDRCDVVVFHAVLEWLAQPLETLEIVADRVKPGGYLSLLFYNYHGFVYNAALKGTWRIPFLLDESRWWGKGKKLTPPHPQKPETIEKWLGEHGFHLKTYTGIRVFHDYIPEALRRETDQQALMELEKRYCREATYRSMGRYVHMLATRV